MRMAPNRSNQAVDLRGDHLDPVDFAGLSGQVARACLGDFRFQPFDLTFFVAVVCDQPFNAFY